jgi:hypothetical protein
MREYGFRAVAHRQTGDHREVALQAVTHTHHANENALQIKKPCVLKVTVRWFPRNCAYCSTLRRLFQNPTLRAAEKAKRASNLATYLLCNFVTSIS